MFEGQHSIESIICGTDGWRHTVFTLLLCLLFLTITVTTVVTTLGEKISASVAYWLAIAPCDQKTQYISNKYVNFTSLIFIHPSTYSSIHPSISLFIANYYAPATVLGTVVCQ